MDKREKQPDDSRPRPRPVEERPGVTPVTPDDDGGKPDYREPGRS